MASMSGEAVRERLAAVIRSLAAEDLEERVAPVKCAKHPDAAECDSPDYIAPMYGTPSPEIPEG